jgi:hypothetical protein
MVDLSEESTTGDATGETLNKVLADVSSLQGSLAGLEGALASIGADSAEAAAKSRSAKTAAEEASTAVAQVIEMLESGDVSSATELIRQMQTDLLGAKQSVEEISSSMGPEQFHDRMMTMATEIQDLASRNGWDNFLKLDTLPVGGDPDRPDGESFGTLSENLQEMQSSMTLMQKLMDKTLNEPVVESTLIGVQ